MARGDNCCDRSKDDNHDYHFKSVFIKTPTSDYSGEPNFLSASVYNQLIDEMRANKNNITKRVEHKYGINKNIKYDFSSTATIPAKVSSGSRISADSWNDTCNQIAKLINDAKAVLSATNKNVNLNVNANDVNNYKYSAGEVLKASKKITHLINLVRRARIHCACHVQRYTPCNSHCDQHTCRRDNCCDKTSG